MLIDAKVGNLMKGLRRCRVTGSGLGSGDAQ